ncbi:MAG: Glycerol-3-phosphate cytidyltransferase TagD [Candidatus Roizmanbacteria bacterium GW2011_GWA2_35_19]|uniref:Glycerol-3-phosphate cytidyltransferase TagD n=2 Tax=Candidatus Roizmaniibacteriota TaxID=1752723 RepID=A0A0G0EEW9_9BACT|nr:MAG: Glycerol-3-phosphate cytidyltransferase TagD [Candidatus Roizmanbacteria bacterium GW2011_GWC2_35_12]KKP73730.1 MAG: Glycerol-3-phosphate cytidyltransferase TagD [Candidatus Roizmanbacteria bacterium GW2011_GWA2_35_19]
MKNKALIIPYSDLKIKTSFFKKFFKDKKTVLVGGCFDILHFGHLKFLKNASLCGNYLIIVLESDEFIKKNKHRTPVHNQKERAEILASIREVDMILLLPKFNFDAEYFEMVRKINPDFVAVTANDPKILLKKNQIEKIGGQLKIVVPVIKEFSTKKIYETFLSS